MIPYCILVQSEIISLYKNNFMVKNELNGEKIILQPSCLWKNITFICSSCIFLLNYWVRKRGYGGWGGGVRARVWKRKGYGPVVSYTSVGGSGGSPPPRKVNFQLPQLDGVEKLFVEQQLTFKWGINPTFIVMMITMGSTLPLPPPLPRNFCLVPFMQDIKY